MKVLITTDLFKPQINGVVTSVINLYDELKKMGVDVKILTLSRTVHSYREGDVFYISSFPLKIYPDVRASVSINNEILDELIEWSPDIIHTQCEFSTLVFAKIIAKKVQCPIVHTYHTMYEHYVRYVIRYDRMAKKLVSVGMKQLLKKCSAIIAPTKKVKKSLKKYGMNSKIAVIPTGLDLSVFEEKISIEEVEKLKLKFNIPREDFIILALGRVAEEKNIDELVDHFGETFERKGNVTFLIAGDGPYKKKLEEKVQKIGYKKIIFTGMIPPTEVYKIYQLADVFVCASNSETQGLTFIEAMANSLPLVCRYDDCLEGMLVDNVNGFYFENREEFTTGVEKMIEDSILREEFGESAKKTSIKYSKEFFAKKVMVLYVEVLSNYRHKPTPKRNYYKLKSVLEKYI
ncbi:1,2-diacylglycerol 3-alpha-glucosyltransferase [Anaerosphaera aminiphila DSM 21120]|uniref:1,2-diacylglycerol 3-alpha-glucosyltransferase n=1 Tax=Anaerosphaera aminiphila DSM 21120 TaxID=1120995 RepID=A0A1M5R2X5_9FIRM|nr:glycosyltransferase [Anaerosphaera aminiphila]SHH20456.1 1,2-diacylglycerol 3-alpha-glucosyltransferase [Anaerosphaera aminiphila DSM 21120]